MEIEQRISFACDTCGGRLNVKTIASGRQIQCPRCQAIVTVPMIEKTQSNDGFGDLPIPTPYSPPPLPKASKPTEEIKTKPKRQKLAALREFRSLHLVSTICRAIAIVIFIGWAAMTIIGLFVLIGSILSGSANGFGALAIAAIPWMGYTIVGALNMLAFTLVSEMIQLAIQIERNTYDAANR